MWSNQPNGYRRRKHHQYLTENTGIPHLDKQITTVLTLMQVSRDWRELDGHFNRLFAKDGAVQQRLPLVIEVDGEAEAQRAFRTATQKRKSAATQLTLSAT